MATFDDVLRVVRALPGVEASDREALLQSDPETFFTTPHYDGYAMVQVRLARIGEERLTELVTEAYATRA